MTHIDINSTHPETELLMAEIRMRRQKCEPTQDDKLDKIIALLEEIKERL